MSCNDGNSPLACGIVFTSLPGQKPGNSTSGTVQITSNASLQTTFNVSEVSAVTTGAGATLCHDLTLTIVDSEGAPVTVYSGALDALPSLGVNTTGGSVNWNNTDTDTFNFTASLGGSASSDMGSTCTVAFLWSQTNT